MNTKSKKNIVIKIGTTSIIKNNKVDSTLLNKLVDIVKDFSKQYNFVIVTSGAVGLGASKLKYKTRPKSLKKLQVASAVGQIELVNQYEKIFNKSKMNIAQVLITKNLIDDREQFVNTTQALNELLSEGIVPVVNENDVVATEELKFGDNDRLSAIVSIIVDAEKLIIITNKEGLYNFNPDKNKDAKKIDYIEFDSEQLNNLIPISQKGEGIGGFSTKIMAAQISGFSGIPTQIISWSKENLTKALLNEKVGTYITASSEKIRLRKLWIAYGMSTISNIQIDEGAKLALEKNASLLSKGVLKIDKSFNIGDGLTVTFNKKIIAKGIAKTDSDSLNSDNLLIHKDDLIIL